MSKPKPSIPPVQMPLRVPPDVKARLEILADLDHASLNQTCVAILEKALKRRRL